MYELFNFRSIHWWNSVFSCPLLYFTQIAKTPVSTSIRHRSDVKVSARCVIDVNPFFLLSGCCYMSVMTYLNIVNSNAYSTVRSGWQESKDQRFRLMALCKVNPQVTSRFLWQKKACNVEAVSMSWHIYQLIPFVHFYGMYLIPMSRNGRLRTANMQADYLLYPSGILSTQYSICHCSTELANVNMHCIY